MGAATRWFMSGLSSDAATVLRLLQRAWPPVTEEQLLAVAAAVGSDEAAPSGVGEDDLRRTVDYGSVVAAARSIVAEGHTLLVEVTDPRSDNPEVVRALVGDGARIMAVHEEAVSLEEVYLGMVGGAPSVDVGRDVA